MSRIYQRTPANASYWRAPIEPIYQALPRRGEEMVRARRPDVTLADRLFIGALMATPREWRPHGIVSWAAEAFGTSRQTLYNIGDWVDRALVKSAEDGSRCREAVAEEALRLAPEVGPDRVARLTLRLLLPGGMSYRAMQVCVDEALGHRPSIGYISELINREGERAGRILAAAEWPRDHEELFLTRDESYFSERPMLLTAEPYSLAIKSGHVEETADGKGWAISLALDLADLGPVRVQIAEDGASFYPISVDGALALLHEAGIDCQIRVQKDVWHILDTATGMQTALDRAAEKALGEMVRFEGPKTGNLLMLKNVKKWTKARQVAEPLMELADTARFLVGCLHDAFEIVDLRSGEIRDWGINHWLLGETIEALAQLQHPRVAQFVTTLLDQKERLLTCLHWLDEKIQPWRADAQDHFQEPELALLFERAVGRAWRLQRAIDNGHRSFAKAARHAAAYLTALIGHDPVSQQLADRLQRLLDAVVRTSCASENINSILKPLIWAHRFFPTRRAAQNWLNLFILWHNMRVFERGKRQGHSPFSLVGVKVSTPDRRPTDDWLEALGYPAAA